MVKAKNRINTNGNGNAAHEVEEAEAPASKESRLTITAPNMQTATFRIVGTTPFVQNAFSEKARNMMKEKQELGEVAKKGKKREPKDFQACFEAAIHRTADGWAGIPANGIRAALISACRAAGFAMTRAKLSVFVEADGFDAKDGTPLVKILKGEPHYCEHLVRQQMTTDIRARAMWDQGWEADVRVRFDADQFTVSDVANLLMRVGAQVGLGEGRPDSRSSAGMGWGLFNLKD